MKIIEIKQGDEKKNRKNLCQEMLYLREKGRIFQKSSKN